jgi:hypothetical protein
MCTYDKQTRLFSQALTSDEKDYNINAKQLVKANKEARLFKSKGIVMFLRVSRNTSTGKQLQEKKMKTLIVLCCFLGLAFSVPNCIQIRQMKDAIINATKSQPGLVPLLLRLGN